MPAPRAVPFPLLTAGVALVLAAGLAGPSVHAQGATSASSSCASAAGRVLEVGPGKPYALPSAAAAAAQAGDVVRIAAGDYRGDVATWRASDLAICGDGGRARLYAEGRSAQGKAIWVIAGDRVIVEDIEFRDAKVPDRNGAGIRAEGAALAVRRCAFIDNENGILGGRPGATIVIEASEFARNGAGDGQSHNLYIGRVDRLEVRASWFHEARIGHNLKSRAKETRIENSYFMDGPTGTSSYLIDVPDGGRVFLRGNLLHKGPRADNPNAIAFGAEALFWPDNALEMVHNSVVVTYPGGAFLSLPRPLGSQTVTLKANLFAGTAGTQLIAAGGFAEGALRQSGNRTVDARELAGAERIDAPRFWSAALFAMPALPEPADTAYRDDAPQPFRLRPLAGPARFAGALQSPP